VAEKDITDAQEGLLNMLGVNPRDSLLATLTAPTFKLLAKTVRFEIEAHQTAIAELEKLIDTLDKLGEL
jgi:hypothetical protein